MPTLMRIPLRPAFFQLLAFLVMTSPHTFAVQIEPNPNPSGNTITITPSAPGENLVPFSNLGTINIEALASFQNSSQFNNVGPLVGLGRVLNAGTIVNADRFNNSSLVTFLEGSQFNNLSSGSYYNGGGVTQINGSFINEGSVDHNSASFRIAETGQYIQRQNASSSVMPITLDRDINFINEGHVQIEAGQFFNRGGGSYFNAGPTEIEALFRNTGQMSNSGQFKVGSNGVYEHQLDTSPGPARGGSSLNTGTFTNAGTTNIKTGVFENHGHVVNSGSFRLAQAEPELRFLPVARYIQQQGGITENAGSFITSGIVRLEGGEFVNLADARYEQSAEIGFSAAPTTTNSGTFTNGGAVHIGEGTVFRNEAGAIYRQEATGTTQINGRFENSGGQVNNAGAITVGVTGEYRQELHPQFSSITVNQSGGTFTNAGLVHLGANTLFGSFGSENGGYVQLAGGRTQIDGVFQNHGGLVSNAGAITIGATGTYFQDAHQESGGPNKTVNYGTFTNENRTQIIGGEFKNHGSVVNAGTFQITSGLSDVETFAQVTNKGSFTNTGTVLVGEGTRFRNEARGHHGGVVNAGLFEVQAGAQVTGHGSYVQNAAAAQTIVNGSFANNIALQQGLLTGNGTVTGHVVNTGGVVRAGGAVAPGTLTLASYTQGAGGRLDFRIGGLLAGTQYDVLKVNGPVTLNGTVNVSLINNFTPNVGDKFDILRGDRITLGQVNFSLPSLPAGETWLTGIVGNFFQLSVAQAQVSAPEPNRLLVMGLGVAWLVLWQWKRRAAW